MVEKNTHAVRSSCPIACGLDIVGDHWSLLIVRDILFFGRHEYKDILKSAEGISSNILSDRLAKLQQTGLLKSMSHPESKKRKIYYLTPKGKDLVHVLISLSIWAMRQMPGQVHIQFDQSIVSQGPKAFAAYLLAQTAEWEKTNGIDQDGNVIVQPVHDEVVELEA